MTIRSLRLILPVTIAALCLGSIAQGQSPEEAESLLKRLDSNGDGVISPSEVPARTQVVLNRLAQRAGMSATGSLTISKVVEKLRGDDGQRREDDRRDDRDRDRGRSEPEPAVPGFGEEVALVGPPGFGADADLVYVSLEERYEKRVLEYTDKILERYDRNKDEKLDSEEIKNARWSSDPKESDLNKDGILTKAELAERIANKYGGRIESNDSSSSSSDRRSSGSSSSRSSGGDSDRYKKYAEALIKQNDKNNNGVLEKDEWESVKVAHGADVSNDGVVTAAELTAKLSGYASRSESSSSRSDDDRNDRDSRDSRSRFSRYSRDRNDRDDDRDDEKSTVRFLTATERLPRGLPDWFLEADEEGNQDGQVHFSEYGDSSEKFREYDLNNDGYVTPRECMAAAEKKAR